MINKESHTQNPKRDEAARKESTFKPVPWIAASVFVLGLAVLAGLYWDRNMTVQDIRFEGGYFVSEQQLKERVDIPMGVKPDSIDFMKVIRNIEQLPYVKKSDIIVEPGGHLLIQITERQPAALLMDGDQKCYIDLEGVKLPLVPGKAVDVPILYGFSASMGDTLKGEAFAAVRNFLSELGINTVSDATISEIAWTPDNGVVALTAENGVKLLFGKEEFKTRLRNWEAFYGEVIRTKGIAAMQSVDLRFRGQIVTRES